MSAVEEAVAQNSVQHIELFKELTGSDGATAERMLAASNGNLQRALDFFFDEQVPLDGATTAVAAPLLPTAPLSVAAPAIAPLPPPAPAGPPGLWQVWLGKAFRPYDDPSVQQTLESALMAGNTVAKIKVSGTDYVVSLHEPCKQTSAADPTKTRPVRRVGGPPPPDLTRGSGAAAAGAATPLPPVPPGSSATGEKARSEAPIMWAEVICGEKDVGDLPTVTPIPVAAVDLPSATTMPISIVKPEAAAQAEEASAAGGRAPSSLAKRNGERSSLGSLFGFASRLSMVARPAAASSWGRPPPAESGSGKIDKVELAEQLRRESNHGQLQLQILSLHVPHDAPPVPTPRVSASPALPVPPAEKDGAKYPNGASVYILRSNGEETLATVKQYVPTKKMYMLDLGKGQFKLANEKFMRATDDETLHPLGRAAMGIRVEAIGLSVDTCSAAGTPDSAAPDADWSWRFAHWMWWPVPHVLAPAELKVSLKLVSRAHATGHKSASQNEGLRPGDALETAEEAEAVLGVSELPLAQALASPHEAVLLSIPMAPMGTLLVRATWRPTLHVPEVALPLDEYGFQVPLKHVLAFQRVHLATKRHAPSCLVQWNALMRRTRADASITLEATELTRFGYVPVQHRPHLWMCLSGARDLMLASSLPYRELVRLAESGEAPIGPGTMKQITKDLPRTFPQHSGYAIPTGLSEALKRVLVTYASYNTSVGYCQSMNFIVAVLLLVADEEGAFWLLVALCRTVVADYHTRELSGLRIDTAAFSTLVAQALPDLNAHFVKLEVPLAFV